MLVLATIRYTFFLFSCISLYSETRENSFKLLNTRIFMDVSFDFMQSIYLFTINEPCDVWWRISSFWDALHINRVTRFVPRVCKIMSYEESKIIVYTCRFSQYRIIFTELGIPGLWLASFFSLGKICKTKIQMSKVISCQQCIKCMS